MMTNPTAALVLVASFCLTFTLALAWCLAGVRTTPFMKKVFPNYQYLLKAHIDYLLMTGLLMIFFLLFTHFRVSPPVFVLAAMSIGSLMNPAGFLMLAIKPDLRQTPAAPFGAVMTGSFVMTTIGYGSASWLVAQAALLAP